MQAFLKVVTVAIMLTFGIADVAGCQQRVGPSALADILSIMDPQELRQLAQQLKILGQFDGRVEGVQGNELEASVLHAYIIYSANGGEAYDMQHWQSIARFVGNISQGKIKLSTGFHSMPITPVSPSFDCKRAQSFRERFVCSDKELASLDVRMAQAYHKKLSVAPNRDRVKSSQRDWIKSTDGCRNRDCLITAYNDQIFILTQASIASPYPNATIFRKEDAYFVYNLLSDTAFEFILSVGVADGDFACFEFDIGCLTIKGLAIGNGTNFYFEDNELGSMSFVLADDWLAIEEVKGSFNSGSVSRQEIQKIDGFYRPMKTH